MLDKLHQVLPVGGACGIICVMMKTTMHGMQDALQRRWQSHVQESVLMGPNFREAIGAPPRALPRGMREGRG